MRTVVPKPTANGHLYEKIGQQLRREIAAGGWRPGGKFLSGAEICGRFKVSIITANRVLNDLAAAGLIERQPGRGNYLQTAATSGNAAARLRRLALIAPLRGNRNLFFDGYYATVAQGVVDCATRQGCEVRMLYLPADFSVRPAALHRWLGMEMDGLAFLGPSGFTRPILALTQAYPAPAVVIDGVIEPLPCVVGDHALSAFQVCRALLAAGHRRVAYLGHQASPSNVSNEADRIAILPAVARETGLNLDQRILPYFEEGEHAREKALVEQWFRQEKITALITSTCTLAQMVQRILKENGRGLQSLSYVAMDAYNLQPWPDSPPVDGTVTDRQKMGEMAFEWLTELAGKGVNWRNFIGKRVVPVVWQKGKTLKTAGK